MPHQPVISAKKFALTGAVLMLALPQFGLCQVTPFQDISDDDIDALDEIVVYGQPTLRQLRKKIYETEESFYDLYNSLSDGKEFDIRCFYRTFRGSHVRRRVCEANFVKRAHAGASFAGRLGQGGPPAWAVIRHKNKLMWKRLEDLVAEHSELQERLLDFAYSKQTFDVAVQERCAATLGICRN